MQKINIQTNIGCGKCNKCALVSKATAKNNRKGIFDILIKTNQLMKEKEYPSAFFDL